MKTIEIKVYQFTELSEKAQQRAIEERRNRGYCCQHLYDEAYKSVKEFNRVFDLKENFRNWGQFSTSHIDDNILELKGLRLRTYLINNYWDDITQGKYYSLWSITDKPFNEHYNKPYPKLKVRHSKVFKVQECPLTGITWDTDLLSPIYDFLNWKGEDLESTTFEDLMSASYSNLKRSIESDVEYRHSDEFISEDLDADGDSFLVNGEEFNI